MRKEICGLRFEVVRDIQAVRRQRGAVRLQTADEPFGPAVGGLLQSYMAASFNKTIQPRR